MESEVTGMVEDVREYNRQMWNKLVDQGNRWTIPVSTEEISDAQNGKWQVVLTAQKPVPADWFPDLEGCRVLCLASGGGQQAPILAAAGAEVTVLDGSSRQLDQDKFVAQRDSLQIRTVEGDMADLSRFNDESFDLVFHPVSNFCVPDVRPIWREAFRVLSHKGVLLAGFVNPFAYLFDWELGDHGTFMVKYKIPYSDARDLSLARRQEAIDKGMLLEFSHSLSDQIGGQLQAGFAITGLYEDHDDNEPLSKFMPLFVATRAVKP
jgi:SAM-dependent methyltransferase